MTAEFIPGEGHAGMGITISADEADRLLAALFVAFPPTAGDQTKSGEFDASKISSRAPAEPSLLAALAPFEPRVINGWHLDKGSVTRIRHWLDQIPFDNQRVFGGWTLVRDKWGWCYVRSTSGRVVPITSGTALR